MEPQIFPFFSALKRNIQKNSVTVSSRSPGCSTAIESRIPALTARVLQLRIRCRAYMHERIYHSNAEICNYCPMNNIILGGFSCDRPGRTNYSTTSISLGEMLTFRRRLRWKKGCRSSCRCWSSGTDGSRTA